MSTELIINSTQNGCRIALLKDKNLLEYHQDDDGERFSVGDIYLGTVKKIVPGLNAAFIDIGHEKDAFLHYLDLGPQFNTLQKYVTLVQKGRFSSARLDKFRNEPDINKHGKINQVLTRNQKILVQVVKEPISTKGPRLSCELSLAGRYIVLVPFGKGINISKKIAKTEERNRLQRLLTSIKPENFGVIIRTVADGKEVAELDSDLRLLMKNWEEGIKMLPKANPRQKVIGEMSLTSALLRDVLNESFDNIHVDDKQIYEEVRAYTKSIAPAKEKIVKFYNNKVKIFENFGIEKQIKSAFGKSVSLRGGGYLIIEHTEAMHV
ncbi:MAG: ribonuclease E/G, partial [Cyclobacteriaceae bacterium]|nr:ribonuclease E/G [Cyclobacteriaceae bacterium]